MGQRQGIWGTPARKRQTGGKQWPEAGKNQEKAIFWRLREERRLRAWEVRDWWLVVMNDAEMKLDGG